MELLIDNYLSIAIGICVNPMLIVFLTMSVLYNHYAYFYFWHCKDGN
jgi:hypothetical protein